MMQSEDLHEGRPSVHDMTKPSKVEPDAVSVQPSSPRDTAVPATSALPIEYSAVVNVSSPVRQASAAVVTREVSRDSPIDANPTSNFAAAGEDDEPLDEEDLPMLEQIVPMKNIKHGWANIAAWASAAVTELGGEEVVSALRRTADAVSETVVAVAVPAWEATAEASEKLAEDLRPALENVAQNASSGWDCLTSACLHGSQSAAALAAPQVGQAAQGIAAGIGALSAAAAEELERLVHLASAHAGADAEEGTKASASAPMTV